MLPFMYEKSKEFSEKFVEDYCSIRTIRKMLNWNRT